MIQQIVFLVQYWPMYHESSLTTSRRPFEFCFSGKHVCDAVVNAIFSRLLGFINYLQNLTHTHRDTAAAKPETFVFEQRMLPGLFIPQDERPHGLSGKIF